jgi:hypothetical protein
VKRVSRALKARARWVGWLEDLTYYLIQNFENLKELLKDYFKRYLMKKVPDWLSIN